MAFLKEDIYFVFSRILAFLKFEGNPSDCMCLSKKSLLFYDLLDRKEMGLCSNAPYMRICPSRFKSISMANECLTDDI